MSKFKVGDRVDHVKYGLGVVEEIHKNGPVTASDISFAIDQPVQFVEREIQRIKQCGSFSKWVCYNPSHQTYRFVPMIKDCPFDSIVYMIKHFYNQVKSNPDFDPKMDLQKKKETMVKSCYDVDYDALDKYLMFQEAEDTMFMLEKSVKFDKPNKYGLILWLRWEENLSHYPPPKYKLVKEITLEVIIEAGVEISCSTFIDFAT